MNLEIGQVFKDKQGNTYTLLSRDKEFGIFKFNAVQKKLKIIQSTKYGEFYVFIINMYDCQR